MRLENLPSILLISIFYSTVINNSSQVITAAKRRNRDVKTGKRGRKPEKHPRFPSIIARSHCSLFPPFTNLVQSCLSRLLVSSPRWCWKSYGACIYLADHSPFTETRAFLPQPNTASSFITPSICKYVMRVSKLSLKWLYLPPDPNSFLLLQESRFHKLALWFNGVILPLLKRVLMFTPTLLDFAKWTFTQCSNGYSHFFHSYPI